MDFSKSKFTRAYLQQLRLIKEDLEDVDNTQDVIMGQNESSTNDGTSKKISFIISNPEIIDLFQNSDKIETIIVKSIDPETDEENEIEITKDELGNISIEDDSSEISTIDATEEDEQIEECGDEQIEECDNTVTEDEDEQIEECDNTVTEDEDEQIEECDDNTISEDDEDESSDDEDSEDLQELASECKKYFKKYY